MPGGEIVEIATSWLVTTTLTFALVIADERRLRADRLARAWPPQSRDAAIIAFGPLALIVHFAKTRGRLRSARGLAGAAVGLAMGVAALLVVLVVSGLVLEAIAYALGAEARAPSGRAAP